MFQNTHYSRVYKSLDRSQAIVEFDISGRITTANDKFLGLLGYRLDEIKGKHHRIFVDPKYSASNTYNEFWDKLRSGLFQSGQFQRFGKNGKEVWIQATYSPVLDRRNKPCGVVKIATDITLQTQKMKEALDRTQAVIEFNMDGTIIDANTNFLQATGYRLDEIVGQHHKMFMDPFEAKSAEYAKFWENLNSGAYQAGDFYRVAKGGQPLWLHASYNPYFDAEGHPYKVVKYATDITRQKLTSQRTNEIVSAMAAATEQLTISIQDISCSVGETRSNVDLVVNKGGDADSSVDRLVTAVKSMETIVKFIRDISAQINLLSLNAAIEAARAGDAGRSFSVVADEIKKLAGQTSKSTENIGTEISGIQAMADDVRQCLKEIIILVLNVSAGTNSVAAATEEQSSVTKEIARQMNSVMDLNHG